MNTVVEVTATVREGEDPKVMTHLRVLYVDWDVATTAGFGQMVRWIETEIGGPWVVIEEVEIAEDGVRLWVDAVGEYPQILMVERPVLDGTQPDREVFE